MFMRSVAWVGEDEFVWGLVDLIFALHACEQFLYEFPVEDGVVDARVVSDLLVCVHAQLVYTCTTPTAHLLDFLLERFLYPSEKVSFDGVESFTFFGFFGEEADIAEIGDGSGQCFFETISGSAEGFHELSAEATAADDSCVDDIRLEVWIVLEDEVTVVHDKSSYFLLLWYCLKGSVDALRSCLFDHSWQLHLLNSFSHSFRCL